MSLSQAASLRSRLNNPPLSTRDAGGGGNVRLADVMTAVTNQNALLDEKLRAFEEYKAANDTRLDEIVRRGVADVVTTEKVDRLDEVLSQLQAVGEKVKGVESALAEVDKRQARPPTGGTPSARSDDAAALRTRAADYFLRTGGETFEDQPIADILIRSASAGTDADGGYVVFDHEEHSILDKLMLEISPMRQVSGRKKISTGTYKKPYGLGGAGTGWVGEKTARPETGTPTLAELSYQAQELYAMPAATRTVLQDAAVDIESWLSEEVADAFAEQEGIAFTSGNGVSKPKGFLAAPNIANASWAHGNLGFLTTGATGAFGADPLDNLIDVSYSLKAAFRANARWMMNRSTLAALRKVKDDNSNYIWQPSSVAGQPSTLQGHAVIENEEMPNIASNSLAVAFGDFKRGYLIVDRTGVSVLRDPYTDKPYILFYTTKRVGGGVQNFEAIKLLKFAA